MDVHGHARASGRSELQSQVRAGCSNARFTRMLAHLAAACFALCSPLLSHVLDELTALVGEGGSLSQLSRAPDQRGREEDRVRKEESETCPEVHAASHASHRGSTIRLSLRDQSQSSRMSSLPPRLLPSQFPNSYLHRPLSPSCSCASHLLALKPLMYSNA